MKKRTAMKDQQSVAFLNIPRDWTYLVGYEYEAINQRGEPKLTKGKKTVTKKIDHIDLLLLDEIRGFKERGNRECFKEAVALAEAVGMVGQEKTVCDKVLQLMGLGFVRAKRKLYEGQHVPKIILEVATSLVDGVAQARRESILEAKRIDSLQANFVDIISKNNLLQEYLQEYLQKYSKVDVETKEYPKKQEHQQGQEEKQLQERPLAPSHKTEQVERYAVKISQDDVNSAVEHIVENVLIDLKGKPKRPQWRYNLTENHFPDLEQEIDIIEYPAAHGVSVDADDFDDGCCGKDNPLDIPFPWRIKYSDSGLSAKITEKRSVNHPTFISRTVVTYGRPPPLYGIHM